MFEDQALNKITIEDINVWDNDTGESLVRFTFQNKALFAFTDDKRVQKGEAQVFLDLQPKDWHKTMREHIENVGQTHEVNVSGGVLVVATGPDDPESLAVLLGCDGLRLRASIPVNHSLHPQVGMLLGTRGRLDLTPGQ